ncbi:hypothetical protein [Methylibium rhizosphaerae]|uniref:hypothetical protein n=1 Tax=Methylibium rhizosphaerae TaxID=2570323 RepID=UPI00112C40E7|nr:hypothetical protein [Methylibium rhizosphaerae]
MEIAAFTVSIITFLGVLIGGLLLRSYVPSYLSEKGKNLASKEDLAHLTGVVEGVKAMHAADIERIKAALQSEGQVTERRRKVYEDMATALSVFISGHDSTQEAQSRFHAAHSAAWLWAPDEVLEPLNRFLALLAPDPDGRTSVEMAHLKDSYVAIVLAMRKDAGFSETTMSSASFQFVKFKAPTSHQASAS